MESSISSKFSDFETKKGKLSFSNNIILTNKMLKEKLKYYYERHLQAANLVMEEFYEQSKKEKALQIQSMNSINMKKRDELPNLQIGWIDQICLPLYQVK